MARRLGTPPADVSTISQACARDARRDGRRRSGSSRDRRRGGGSRPPPPPQAADLALAARPPARLVTGRPARALAADAGRRQEERQEVVVPNVINQSQSSAVARVNRRGLVARTAAKPSIGRARQGFRRRRRARVRDVARRSVVTLSVSAANVEAVPNVLGKPRDRGDVPAARAGLHGRHLERGLEQAARHCSRQSPAAGAKVAKGSTVVIRISRGQATVPDVVGQTRATAVAAVRAAGLVPQAFIVPSTQPKGTVVAQRPKAGTRVPGGSKVRLNVSSGRPRAASLRLHHRHPRLRLRSHEAGRR